MGMIEALLNAIFGRLDGSDTFSTRQQTGIGTTAIKLAKMAQGSHRLTVQNASTTTLTIGPSDTVLDGKGVILKNATAANDGDGGTATFITKHELWIISDAASGVCNVTEE